MRAAPQPSVGPRTCGRERVFLHALAPAVRAVACLRASAAEGKCSQDPKPCLLCVLGAGWRFSEDPPAAANTWRRAASAPPRRTEPAGFSSSPGASNLSLRLEGACLVVLWPLPEISARVLWSWRSVNRLWWIQTLAFQGRRMAAGQGSFRLAPPQHQAPHLQPGWPPRASRAALPPSQEHLVRAGGEALSAERKRPSWLRPRVLTGFTACALCSHVQTHAETDLRLDLMLCGHHLEFFLFPHGFPHFHLALRPTS